MFQAKIIRYKPVTKLIYLEVQNGTAMKWNKLPTSMFSERCDIQCLKTRAQKYLIHSSSRRTDP